MTLYEAIKKLKTKGYYFVKHYGTFEVWTNELIYIHLPNQNIMPKHVERLVKRG